MEGRLPVRCLHRANAIADTLDGSDGFADTLNGSDGFADTLSGSDVFSDTIDGSDGFADTLDGSDGFADTQDGPDGFADPIVQCSYGWRYSVRDGRHNFSHTNEISNQILRRELNRLVGLA